MVDKKYFGLQKKKITNSIKVKVFLLNFFHILTKLLKFDAKSFFFRLYWQRFNRERKKNAQKIVSAAYFMLFESSWMNFFHLSYCICSFKFFYLDDDDNNKALLSIHFHYSWFLSFFCIVVDIGRVFFFWLLLNSSIYIFNRNKEKLLKFS